MSRQTLRTYGLLACLIHLVSSTALTYKLAPNEQACFFTDVQQQGAKIAFYFAVCSQFVLGNIVMDFRPDRSIQVQSGGSFDVDYTVRGPKDNIIMENSKERQLDAVFTAKDVGEYKFCFNNEMSTYTDKMVDFEIAVRGHFLAPPSPTPRGPSTEPTYASLLVSLFDAD